MTKKKEVERRERIARSVDASPKDNRKAVERIMRTEKRLKFRE